MYFEQFYLGCLAHASYLLGSDGVGAVVDPQRDVDLYLEEAAKNGLQIRHIIETHLHADFVSGHFELAQRTGATIYLGGRSGAKFPHQPVTDGDEIAVGRAKLEFLETPGHTPESISVLVTDLDRGPNPWAVLTGDTLFIGDVGRPDLSAEYTAEQLASMLYDSLHGKLLKLPDDVEVYPAHGAGSLCGRQISAERRSTIGMQRYSNYACRPMSREEFIRVVTTDLPPRPEYFAQDVELNRSGAHALSELPPLPAFLPAEALQRQSHGAIILDTRPAIQFGAAHIPGAVHIALSGQYASWAAALIGLSAEIILVSEDETALRESRMRLARVGIEKVAGFLDGGIVAWLKAGLPMEFVPQITVVELQQWLAEQRDFQLVDVRRPSEWQDGTINGALRKPLDKLMSDLDGLDPARPIVVHCKSGYRSSIAASLLARAGYKDVMNLVGGYDAWQCTASPAPAQPVSCS